MNRPIIPTLFCPCATSLVEVTTVWLVEFGDLKVKAIRTIY